MTRYAIALLLTLFVILPGSTKAEDGARMVAQGAGASRPQQPQIALTEDGVIHLTYGADGKAHYVAIEPGDSTKQQVSTLPSSGVLSLGMRRGPRIAVAKDTICIALIAGPQGKGKDGDILALRSKDKGASWSQAIKVNNASGSAREGLHALATSTDGGLACVWLDLRNKQSEVMCSYSKDAGATWSENALVYKSPDGDVCPCCHPSVTFGPLGEIHVMWRNELGGARDMFVATSEDQGKSFSAAQKLGQGTWKLNACPMDGGMICASKKGQLDSIWRRENKIFLCEFGKKESDQGAGEQPWIAATSQGLAATWVKKRGEALYLLKPGEHSPIKLTDSALDPVIAASPDGNSYAVAWERTSGKQGGIMLQTFSISKK
jgi:hypothetical protein